MRWFLLWSLLGLSAAVAQVDVTAPPYSAVCDGATDDSAAIQAVVSAVEGLPGAGVYVPRMCAIQSSILVTKAITIRCADRYTSGLVLLSSGMVGIDVRSDKEFTLVDCGITSAAPGGQTGGSCIALDGSPSGVDEPGSPTGINTGSVIERNRLDSCYVGIDLINAARLHIVLNQISSSSQAGVRLRNSQDIDAGDADISSNQIFGKGGSLANIWFQSGSGVRVMNNKLQTADFGFYGDFVNAATTNDVLIEGNSIEGHVIDSIRLRPQGALTQVSLVNIVGNELHPNPGLGILRVLSNPADGIWMKGVVVSGNTGLVTGLTATRGLEFFGVQGLMVGNNYWRNWGAPNAVNAIIIRGSTNFGYVEHQSFIGWANCVQNLSANFAVVASQCP